MKRIMMMALVAMMAAGCGNNKQIEQPAQEPVQAAVMTVGVDEFAKAIAQNGVLLIDVRTPNVYAEEHIGGAVNIDVKAADFAGQIKGIEGTVAVYCVKGVRSLKAANQLAAQGCTVYDLDGGINAWKQAGRPTAK
ncbi:MAG: rhodanese-like domain-containing protein [Bacteroidales bacterium]|nr:rhodanese-like domain-containing protein [Bacteroidales bacterium]